MPTDQTFFFPGRILVWMSAGAASSCAAALAKERYPDRDVRYVYCDVSLDEHADNRRFLADVERWLGITVERIRNPKYSTTDEVFADKRFMSSPNGACCTAQLKKAPRFLYQYPEDIHVFGFTLDETMPMCRDPRRDRIASFERENFDLFTDWVLRDAGMTKKDCHAMIARAGIRQSEMYRLGFDHGNCKACVKATSPDYWNRTRRCFPDDYARRARQSREIGARLVRYKGQRIFLDELPPEADEHIEENLSCGPQCAPAQIENKKAVAEGRETDSENH